MDRMRPPLSRVFRGPRGRLLLAFLLTEFAAGVSGLSYAAVLPVAARELDGLALYGPAVAASSVVGIGFMAVGAFLYGRLGPQMQLWLSTAVFLTGVALTAGAPSMEFLVAGLAVRGIAAGLMAGLGLGLLSGLYPDPGERERVFGLFALMWVVPSLVGPVVNGLLLATVGWRMSMVWPAVLLLFGRTLVSRHLHVVVWERSTTPSRVRGAGAFVLIAGGLLAAQVGVSVGLPLSVLLAVAALVVVLLVPFRRALRLTVPEQSRARAGGWALALVCGSYFGVNAFVPLLSATYLDRTGIVGTVLVSLGPLTWALVSAGGIGGRLPLRDAYRLAAVVFPTSGALIAVWVLSLSDSPRIGAVVLGVVVVLIGAAMGAIYPKVMTQTFEGFEERDGTTRAHGGVVLSVSEDVGTAIGVTVLAGVGALVVGVSARWTVGLAGVFALCLTVAWVVAARNILWQHQKPYRGVPG